jgi:hypothetical protein
MPNTLDLARLQKIIADMRQAGRDTKDAEAHLGSMFAILRASHGYPVEADQARKEQARPDRLIRAWP